MKYLVLAIVSLGLAACVDDAEHSGPRYVGTCSVYLSAEQCHTAEVIGKARGTQDRNAIYRDFHYCQANPSVCD
jgi:hypothetical protein